MKFLQIKNKVDSKQAKIVEAEVKRCMRHLMKNQYELDIPKNAQHCVPLTIRYGRGPSRAGARGITINLGSGWFAFKRHGEYAAYDSDPVIGGIECKKWIDHLRVIVAHEVSHYVQYKYLPRLGRFHGQWKKPHGYGFQTIYRYLRRDLINPMIQTLETPSE